MIVLGIVVALALSFFFGQMSRNKIISGLQNEKDVFSKEVNFLMNENVGLNLAKNKLLKEKETSDDLLDKQDKLIDALDRQVDAYKIANESNKKVIQEVAIVFEQMKKHHLEDGKYIDSLQKEALYWRNLAIEAGKFIRANHPDIEEAYQKAKLQVN